MFRFSQEIRLTTLLTSRIAAVARCSYLTMLSLCLIALCRPSLGLDTSGDQYFVAGHVYVAYTSDWVPSAQGTLIDVTTELVADDDRGHVNDIHGNTLTIDSASNTVYDSNAQATGFVYGPPHGL